MEDLVIDHLRTLYEVHEKPEQDKRRKAELETTSRVFGMLLHSFGAKSETTQTEAVSRICQKVTMRCMKNGYHDNKRFQLRLRKNFKPLHPQFVPWIH